MSFDLEGYKELLLFSHEHSVIKGERDKLRKLCSQLNVVISSLEERLYLEMTTSGMWKEEYIKQRAAWVKENELRHEAELEAASIWSWITAGGGGLVLATGAVLTEFDEGPAPWVLTGAGALTTTIGLVDIVF